MGQPDQIQPDRCSRYYRGIGLLTYLLIRAISLPLNGRKLISLEPMKAGEKAMLDDFQRIFCLAAIIVIRQQVFLEILHLIAAYRCGRHPGKLVAKSESSVELQAFAIAVRYVAAHLVAYVIQCAGQYQLVSVKHIISVHPAGEYTALGTVAQLEILQVLRFRAAG